MNLALPSTCVAGISLCLEADFQHWNYTSSASQWGCRICWHGAEGAPQLAELCCSPCSSKLPKGLLGQEPGPWQGVGVGRDGVFCASSV